MFSRLALGVVLVGIATSGVAGCLAAHRPVLLVEDATHQRVLYRAPVEAGNVLTLSYVHSSELVPVRGTIVVGGDGALLVTETAFGGFGPGLPAPKLGDPWRLEAGMIVVSSTGKSVPELRLRVAPFTHHRLRVPSGEELDLSALTDDGAAVRIYVTRSP